MNVCHYFFAHSCPQRRQTNPFLFLRYSTAALEHCGQLGRTVAIPKLSFLLTRWILSFFLFIVKHYFYLLAVFISASLSPMRTKAHYRKIGRKGGRAILKKRGAAYFRKLSLRRKSFKGGRPRKGTIKPIITRR